MWKCYGHTFGWLLGLKEWVKYDSYVGLEVARKGRLHDVLKYLIFALIV